MEMMTWRRMRCTHCQTGTLVSIGRQAGASVSIDRQAGTLVSISRQAGNSEESIASEAGTSVITI